MRSEGCVVVVLQAVEHRGALLKGMAVNQDGARSCCAFTSIPLCVGGALTVVRVCARLALAAI